MIVHATERPHALKRRPRPWNRCDDCGRFIAMEDFDKGLATRTLTSLDTAFSSEGYETLCREHSKGAKS